MKTQRSSDTTAFRNHTGHSRLVRNFSAEQVKSLLAEDVTSWHVVPCCTFRSPHEGYLVQVSFSTYPDHPEYVRVFSTNWRAEHEPRGVYHAVDARAFYRKLRDAGFTKIVPE